MKIVLRSNTQVRRIVEHIRASMANLYFDSEEDRQIMILELLEPEMKGLSKEEYKRLLMLFNISHDDRFGKGT